MWYLAACIALALVVVTALAVSHWPWRRLTRSRVIVVLDSERVIEGVLWARRGPLLVIRDARIHEQGRQVPADGEVVIDRARVQWMQVIR